MKEHVLSLARNYSKGRYNLMVCSPDHGEILTDLRRVGVFTYPINLKGNINPFADFQAFRQLVWLLRQQPVHLVHTHGAKAGLIGRLAAARAGVPVVVATFHNFIYGEDYARWKRAAFSTIQRRMVRYTDHAIAVSEALARDIQRVERFPMEKVTTIYNGLSLEKFNQITEVTRKKRDLGLDITAPVVGVVARLIPQKGVGCFLKAAKMIQAEIPGVNFLIVGDGPARKSLEKQSTELGLRKTVFAGFRFDVPQLLPIINIFVIPSLSEGLSIGALEAMAARRPIVASRVGGLPELIQHGKTGMLVAPNNPWVLAKTVMTLLERPFFAEVLGMQARVNVERKFSEKFMVDSTEAVYEKLLSAKGVTNEGGEFCGIKDDSNV
ncbi:glycosyltransferase [Metallumcola ferriviriculae]|uniref:Glycosyltransferase n=1 Tax=Metallumcola ferriviriculae TaxID=3039180 RepID=A0AAU0URK7_9FIRM|nr:glycosyltransferase [Desulfitibacteraceae bacterium MK1]